MHKALKFTDLRNNEVTVIRFNGPDHAQAAFDSFVEPSIFDHYNIEVVPDETKTLDDQADLHQYESQFG